MGEKGGGRGRISLGGIRGGRGTVHREGDIRGVIGRGGRERRRGRVLRGRWGRG